MKKLRTKYFIKTALFSTISFFLTFLTTSVFQNASFLKLNFSDFPAIIASLTLSPFAGIFVLFLKLVLTLLFKSFNLIARLSSFILSVVFILPLMFFRKRFLTIKSLFFRLILSIALYTLVNFIYNYFIFLPLFGYSPKLRLCVAVTCILPFGLIKGGMLTILTLFFYNYLITVSKNKT